MGRDDEVGPPIEIIDIDERGATPTRVSVGGGRGPQRGLVVLAIAVVAVVVGLAALGGGDNSAGPTADDPTTTTEADSTTTSSGRGTTTTVAPIGPIIPEASGSMLVILGGIRQVAVDLATGERTELNAVDDPWSTVSAAGGLVQTSGGEAIFVPLPEGDEVSLGSGSHAVATERSDRIWIVAGDPGAEVEARQVDPSGHTVAGPVSLPGNGQVIMATTRYLVLDAGVRRYRVDIEGGLTPLDGVVPLSPIDPDRALATICDREARCSVGVIDLDTGRTSKPSESLDVLGFNYPPGPPDTDERSRRVAVLMYGDGLAEVVALEADGSVIDGYRGHPEVTSVVWLPGGETMLMTDGTDIYRWSPGSGEEAVRLTDVPDLDGALLLVLSSSAGR